MIRVMFAGLRATALRLTATGLAVVLSVGFVVATLTLSATFAETTEQTLTANMANSDARVTPTVAMVASSDPRTSTDVVAGLLPKVLAAEGVSGADVERLAYVDLRVGETRTVAQVSGLLDESVRWQQLKSGEWPQALGEATIDEAASTALGAVVGDTVTFAATGAGVGPTSATVVGITTSRNAGAETGVPNLLMVPEALDDPALFAISTGILVSGDGVSPTRLAAAVTSSLAGASGVVVQTIDQAVDYQTGQLSGSASVLTSIMLSFAVVALFVASMVIANTFQVLVAQRTRELALLRCIGASTGQVRRLILGEAVILGAVASGLGLAAGVGAASVLASASRTDTSGLHLGELVIDERVLVGGFVIGMILTVLSALKPAQKATRVRPVAALRATDAPGSARRWVARAFVAALLISAGGIGLWLGATRTGLIPGITQSGLAVAVASAVVSFLGVLVASSLFVPWLVRAAGFFLAWTSVPARLASLNATRNPARTASTAAALLVGVTLVAMMAVGVTSVRDSVNAKIDQKRPIDLTVQTINPQGMTSAQVDAVRGLAGITNSAVLSTGMLTIAPASGSQFRLPARGLALPDAKEVSRSQATVAEAGTVVLNPQDAREIRNGQSVTVRGADGAADFVARIDEEAPRKQVTIAASDLVTLTAAPATKLVQVRLDDKASGAEVQQISTAILSLGEDLRVGGGAPERVYYEQILDVMLLIVLALLAIAVVIAVVGVANTMALSVIERRRESALLRALGLTRGQLRSMLAMEAALITVVAAAIGICLGIVYAWAGLSAVGLQATKLSLEVHLPWSQLGMVIGGALIAGLIASVVPARAAARRSPIEGLANG